jgi:hypothetical protein
MHCGSGSAKAKSYGGVGSGSTILLVSTVCHCKKALPILERYFIHLRQRLQEHGLFSQGVLLVIQAGKSDTIYTLL